ncbi:olfactory receptor 7D11-like [Callospermophilus lateralis]
MNPQLCVHLVLMSWLILFWVSPIQILLLNQLTFSTGTEIPHFFCELAQLLKVASSDTLVNNIFMYVVAALLGVVPVTGILFSYSQILSSLMRMSSSVGKSNAFYTLGSHFWVISFFFYEKGFGVPLSSAVTHSSLRTMIASMVYTVVTLMLYPSMYSLGNQDVKGPLGGLLSRAASSP